MDNDDKAFSDLTGATDVDDVDVGVAIIGGGVAGATLFDGLAALGHAPFLIEQNVRIGDAASTRNEGWAHCSYHAVAIDDEEAARNVALAARYGHSYFERESLNANPFSTTFAFTRRNAKIGFIEDRWTRFGIEHNCVNPKHLTSLFPGMNTRGIAAAYAVEDFAIDTTKLLDRVVHRGRIAGGMVETGAEVIDMLDGALVVRTHVGRILRVRPRITVVTCGAGIKPLCKRLWGIDVKQSFYRSHLLLAKPVAQMHSIFSLDPGDVTAMVHAHGMNPDSATYVIGLNRDAERIEEPDRTPNEVVIKRIVAKAERLLGSPFANHYGYACIKTDLDRPVHDACYDLSARILEPIPSVIIAVPGKMTEAPLLAHLILERIRLRIGPAYAAKRPLDKGLF